MTVGNEEGKDIADAGARELRARAAQMMEEGNGPEIPLAWWFFLVYDILLLVAICIDAPDNALAVALLLLASVALLAIDCFFAKRRGLRIDLVSAGCFTAGAIVDFLSGEPSDAWAIAFADAGIAIIVIGTLVRIVLALFERKGDAR